MIRRRLLQSGLTAVLVCGFAQAGLAAAKADDAVLAPIHAPTSGWSVGPIAARSADGTQFCSMKNSYQNGQSLVFARDTKGSNSIALDLHKDLFEAGHHYNIKLQTGALTRRVQALAATTQVLAMEMGIDTIFYGTIARKHNVIFTIQDIKHGFELDVSVADGLNALGRCTESLQPGSNISFTAFSLPLGKVSDTALQSQQADEPFTEEAAAEEQPVAPPSKKHHGKAAKAGKEQKLKNEIAEMQDENRDLLLKNEKLREELTDQSVAVVTPAPAPAPAPSPANTARDEMKAEIASEILNMKENGPVVEKASRAEAPAPVVAVVPPAPVAPPHVEVVVPPAPPVSPPPHVAVVVPPAPPVAAPRHIVEAAPAVVKPVTVDNNTDLKKLIKDSQVAGGTLTTDKRNTLHWASDDLYGSAQELPMLPGRSLTEMANNYIQKSSALCKGEFAQKLGSVKRAGKVDVLEAEITCLDGKNNAAAAVLFVGGQGKFSVITQEGTIDQLDAAMSDRDAILSTASGTATN